MCLFFFCITLEPRDEWYKGLRALDTSPLCQLFLIMWALRRDEHEKSKAEEEAERKAAAGRSKHPRADVYLLVVDVTV